MAGGTLRVFLALARRSAPARVLVGRVLVGAAVGGLLAAPVRATFLAGLDGPVGAWPGVLEGAWLRAALVALVVAALDVHGRVLRGELRAGLSLLPVDAGAVVRADVIAALRTSAPATVAVGVAFGGVAASAGPVAWAAGAFVVVGAALLGAVSAALAFLGAVRAAEDPRWAPVLDLVRGANPRGQAAIVWALAPAVAVSGGLLAVASAAAAGAGVPAVGVVVPWLGAAAVWPAVAPAGRGAWWSAGHVVADIRARYAAVERPEDVGRVWLDGWAARLPPALGREVLLQLRHGWRERRGLLSALWLAGLAAAVAGWTSDPAGIGRAGLAVGVGAFVAGFAPLAQAAHEPRLLRTWLPRPSASRAGGAAVATAAWSVGSAVAAALALTLRQGPGAAAAGVAVGLALVVVASAASAVGVLVAPAAGTRGGYAASAALVLGLAAWGVR